jgi:LPS sulfotransferase NodH
MSTIKMRNKVLEKLALQKGDRVEIEKQVINNYKRLMKSYFEQKNLIPKRNLVEIRYEDLVKNPVGQVQEIYSKLRIPITTKTTPAMKQYLERKKNYKTNMYTINQEIISHVKKEWNFTIDRWNYNPP